MLAAVCHGARDLRVEEFDPGELAPDEVLVSVAYGGICGSDLHYYHRGGVGDFSIREPMVLGHEISGTVAAVGSSVTALEPGMKAALDPSKPCLSCRYCRAGRSNLCLDMKFLGSAGRFPHVQGGFARRIVLRQDQVIPVPQDTDLLALSVAEPLSVGLHAVTRAGDLRGKRVIVTGSGPIGLLTALSAIHAGAAFVVATDIEDAALRVAKKEIGVDAVVNVASDPDGLAAFSDDDSHFDVALEASGSPAALASLFPVMRRGGRIVQLGMMPPGEVAIPINPVQTREIELVGAFRAHDEFRLAAQLITSGKIDVSPILSGTYALEDAVEAFALAGDRSRVVKLHLAIAGGAA
ncbi:L-idonate 5-dehydrogenase [Aurantiacibacter odishensis]|uniref:L-idonate 5-dehydrogenase n=1 Tax=Aurantiacibacter odishensis TaxID=1155476 RepID=UPI000E728CF7|nr:L-idonate 5-dehydrogenase [Aurantiacibacter odishensis]